MDSEKLRQCLSQGEDGRNQFKESIERAEALAQELVAFSNSRGGRIFAGVTDEGQPIGLSAEAVRALNQILSSSSSQNVRPPIATTTENIAVAPNCTVVVITVPEGLNKPYMDSEGLIWVKSGADKRKAYSREELHRLFAQSSLVHADETAVERQGAEDVDVSFFREFFLRKYEQDLDEVQMPLGRLLANMNLMKGGPP